MHPLGIALMTFGGLITLIGIAVFVIKGSQDSNALKFMNMELNLGSSLIIIILGIILILAPIFLNNYLPAQTTDNEQTTFEDDEQSVEEEYTDDEQSVEDEYTDDEQSVEDEYTDDEQSVEDEYTDD